MPKRTKDYRSWQLAKLSDPQVAASYLNAAMSDSREMFLKALRNVAQARQMTRVAKEAGVQRETLYRSFCAEGNPTLDTLLSVLSVFKIKTRFAAEGAETSTPPSPIPQPRLGISRRTRRNRVILRDVNQIALPFPPEGATAGTPTLETPVAVKAGIIFDSSFTAAFGFQRQLAPPLRQETSGSCADFSDFLIPAANTTTALAVPIQ